MSHPAEAPVPTNHLIEALPARARASLMRQVSPVELLAGRVLCEQGQRYRDAYFPLTSRLSEVAGVAGHPLMQVSRIGSEGMLGATLLLGVARAPLRVLVQGSGSAWRLGAAQLRQELRGSPALRDALGRYLFLHVELSAQGTACARFHEVEPRLARCLLMVHDQAHADHFHLTHQILADMLGVQRSAVTLSAGSLQRAGLIRYSRGRIDILSRRGLEDAACGCYKADFASSARSDPSG
jgi:CRP-like cAMP-binding protein